LKNRNIYIIIPAKRESEGFPFKNRKLFKYTADLLANYKNVIVTTDDENIITKAKDYNFLCIKRNSELALPETSMKDVLLDVVEKLKLKQEDILVTLYLTYPYRKSKDIKKAICTFKKNNCSSLLCIEPVKTHPYLTVIKNKRKWKPLIKHKLYRRQDYPEIREISHYIVINNVKEINKLNNNLYDKNTYYFEIDRVKDIDYEKDLKDENITL